MSKKILISTSKAVLLFDLETQNLSLVHEGRGIYYGITKSEDAIIIGARNYKRHWLSFRDKKSEQPQLLFFNHSLELRNEVNFPVRALGLHQIYYANHQIFCTCSESNSVVIYNDHNWSIWYPSSDKHSINKDINHFNSIYVDDNFIYLLAHNNGPSSLLRYCLKSKKLIEQINIGVKAHNIFWHKGEIATCSSGEGKIISQSNQFANVEGFPRGVVASENWYYVGLSHKTNRANRANTQSFIEVFDKETWKRLDRISLGTFGQVTDLFLINE